MKLHDGPYAGTGNSQFVNFRGRAGETGEKQCVANFASGHVVTCSIESGVDIGDYMCLLWRTGGGDGWDFVQVGI